jgi:hypothetical protein
MYVCIFTRLNFLEVTRIMVLFMLFTHTNTFLVEGISLIGYAYMTVSEPFLDPNGRKFRFLRAKNT